MSAAQVWQPNPLPLFTLRSKLCFAPNPEGAENTEVVEMQNSDSAGYVDLGVHHYVYDHKGNE